MARKSTVTGHKQAKRNLTRLSKSLAAPIGVASRFALQPMLKTAKDNIRTPKPGRPDGNVITGDLVDSMAIRKVKKTPRGQTSHHVTATGRGVGKAHLVEFGTDPHWQPRRGIMHPGARPFPFLTPAYEEHDDDAIRRFGKKVGPEVEAAANRVSRKKR